MTRRVTTTILYMGSRLLSARKGLNIKSLTIVVAIALVILVLSTYPSKVQYLTEEQKYHMIYTFTNPLILAKGEKYQLHLALEGKNYIRIDIGTYNNGTGWPAEMIRLIVMNADRPLYDRTGTGLIFPFPGGSASGYRYILGYSDTVYNITILNPTVAGNYNITAKVGGNIDAYEYVEIEEWAPWWLKTPYILWYDGKYMFQNPYSNIIVLQLVILVTVLLSLITSVLLIQLLRNKQKVISPFSS